MVPKGICPVMLDGLRFSPISLFLRGEQGAWYDPSDLTTLFQDSAGTIPVTAVEQPVGLMLDKSKGLALGAELVTNGTFDTNVNGWTGYYGAAVTLGAGVMVVTNSAGVQQGAAATSFTTVIGQTYIFKASYSSVSTVYLGVGNGPGLYLTTRAFTGTGSTTSYFTATATTTYVSCQLLTGLGLTANFDNISIKQIAGNHAFQATAGNRPTLSARVNLLTKTEDFSDAAWTKDNTSLGSIVVAPDGSLTANVVSTTTASGLHRIYNTTPLTSAVYARSLYVKAGTAQFVKLTCELPGLWCIFDVLSGTVVSSLGTTSNSIIPVGNNWYRISIGCSNNATYITLNIQETSEVDTYVGTGKTIYIWGADLRPPNSGALLPPYQRVNTDTNYDTVGFPLYLKCNGTSSAMLTNSIDFTATDKMTVVTGVRKLSDRYDSIIELSATLSNAGSFQIANNTTNAYGYALNGSVVAAYAPTTYIPPISNVLAGLFDISGALIVNEITPRINGIVNQTNSVASPSAGTGNFGNYPLYLFARGGTTLWLNGNFYGAIIRGAQSDTASVTQTENYMATKTGITF